MIKKINLTFFTAFVIAGLVLSVQAARADGALFASLSVDEQAAIQNGDQVVHTEDVDGSGWPSVVVYQSVAASPEQLAAGTCLTTRFIRR